MRVCLFSDVHANLPALETLIGLTKHEVDGYVCLGDTVNYGPWNDECLEAVHALPNVTMLEGNHERLFMGTESAPKDIPLVQAFLATSSQWFSRRDLVENLPTEHLLGDFKCLHTIGERRVYADTAVDVPGNFFIGHTHHQFRTDRPEGIIVNCGSIGQNRRRGDRIAYAIWNAEDNSVSLHESPYPVDRFVNELVVRRYPERCIQYYQELINRGRA